MGFERWPRVGHELHANLDALELSIPDALWSELESEALIPRGSPRPTRAPASA